MALCSRTDTAKSGTMYAVREVMQLRAVGNFVSADRIQVDRIELRWDWIQSKSNLARSADTPFESCNVCCICTVTQSGNVCCIYLHCFVGETDWKILAIDVADPLAEKLNGMEELWKWVDQCTAQVLLYKYNIIYCTCVSYYRYR